MTLGISVNLLPESQVLPLLSGFPSVEESRFLLTFKCHHNSVLYHISLVHETLCVCVCVRRGVAPSWLYCYLILCVGCAHSRDSMQQSTAPSFVSLTLGHQEDISLPDLPTHTHTHTHA